jgi:glycosyltransferase involved in cell wall biosynthesis
MSSPACSIITINFNNLAGLKKTVESVVKQRLVDFEYIVIDGGSSDGSKEFIETHSSEINYWISEMDSGVYHAMNKGVKVARGEYVLFLNSGDYFFSEESLSVLIREGQSRDLIYGNLMVDDGSILRIKRYPPVLTFGYFLEDTLPHPATLIKRDLLLSNLYNEENRIVSDWEFFVNGICKLNVSYIHVDAEVSVFNLEGVSSMPSNQLTIEFEKKRFLQMHYSAFLDDYNEAKRLQKIIKEQSFLFRITRFIRNIRF